MCLKCDWDTAPITLHWSQTNLQATTWSCLKKIHLSWMRHSWEHIFFCGIFKRSLFLSTLILISIDAECHRDSKNSKKLCFFQSLFFCLFLNHQIPFCKILINIMLTRIVQLNGTNFMRIYCDWNENSESVKFLKIFQTITIYAYHTNWGF